MAVAITQTADPAGVSTSANAATYTGVSTGTASPDRVVVVLAGKEVATVTVSSVTIDGLSMTNASGTTFGNMGTQIYWRAWPSGTTAEVIVNYSGAATNVQNHIAVYAITGASFPPISSGSNSSTDMDATTPLTTGSQTIATGGGILLVAASANDATTKTWANATGDINTDAGDFRFSTATRTTSGTVTITCTGSTNNEDGVLAWILMLPEAIPSLVMAPPR